VAAAIVWGFGIGNWVLVAVLGLAFYLVGLLIVAGRVEGRRAARDRIWKTLVYTACVLAVLPLASVVWTLLSKGLGRLDANFFGTSMNNIGARDPNGGAYHAIIGTLVQVGIATLLAVPLGVLGAIYLVEYGRGRFALTVRFFMDVMTGIPSIVAGLFILSFWVLIVSPWFNGGQPRFSGFAASLALTVLMLPTIVRSTEEMLRLVPGPLREGAYALGVPQWKTILKIVLPTALPGIVTGIMLAVARAAGETAPVLLVAGGAAAIKFDPFGGNQSSLSLFVFQQAGDASRYAPARAWTAALTLVALVLALTVAAKLLARRNRLTR
jgi:phosphate transport system permease protein